MKKISLIVCMLILVLSFAVVAEAGTYWATFPDGNNWMSWNSYSWDGWDNVQFYYNNNNSTVGIAILDPNGTPQIYYYADFFSYYYDFYYSYDGAYWYYIGSYY